MVALAVSLAALLLIARPLQLRLAQSRLAAELSLIAPPLRQALARAGQADGVTPRQLLTFLNQRLPPLTGRLLILKADGTILFDSRNQWLDHTISLPPPPRRRAELFNGQFVGPDGSRYIFAAAPLQDTSGDSPARLHAVLAAPLPAAALNFVRDLWGGFLIAGLIAVSVSLLLSLLIARSVAGPLRAIALATGAIARGDYTQTVPETGPDEVKQVARSINSMTGQIQAGRVAVQDFVSNVSHELKTPLTSIQGFSQALLEGATQDKNAQNRAAKIIYDEATRMRRLVEDLLDLARIDAGQLAIGKTPIDLATLLNAILTNLSHQAGSKNLKLIKTLDALPAVRGDGDRLTQVFTNLLDNAIKHTPPGGVIRVKGTLAVDPQIEDGTGRSGRRYACVTITDSGPGIPPGETSRVFERFYQLDKSRQKSRGVGLGLAIAHDIVKAHGGHIKAQNAAGQGTQIITWLPVSEADISTLISRRA
ncbi:MAG: ATP-binding protein [Anaerolineae bacterium]